MILILFLCGLCPLSRKIEVFLTNYIITNQPTLIHPNPDMPAFLAEIIPMVGAFIVLFSILFCGLKPDKEDSYTRRLRKLRNHKCECRKCKKN